MAAARDQAARVLRPEADVAGGEAAREASAAIADSIRAQLSDETARRGVEAPELPVTQPAVQETSTARAVSKAGKRKFVFMGIVAALALAVAAYGVHWLLVGRFHVSTDDDVRANNTTLGARVSGHIAAIFPHDNSVVHAGDVIFKID